MTSLKLIHSQHNKTVPAPRRPDDPQGYYYRLSMPFNTFTVACSTAPTAISTFIHHYMTSKGKRHCQHPAKKQLSYHEGVNLIRQFLSLQTSFYYPNDRTCKPSSS